MSTWSEVCVDDRILDGRGQVWRVCAIDESVETVETTGAFRCKNADDQWTTISPKPIEAPVTIVAPEEAPEIALLRDRLGAVEIATQDTATKKWSCAPWPTQYKGSLIDFRSHLELAHGMYVGDVKTFAKLVEAHTAAHDPDEPHVGKHLVHEHRRI